MQQKQYTKWIEESMLILFYHAHPELDKFFEKEKYELVDKKSMIILFLQEILILAHTVKSTKDKITVFDNYPKFISFNDEIDKTWADFFSHIISELDYFDKDDYNVEQNVFNF